MCLPASEVSPETETVLSSDPIVIPDTKATPVSPVSTRLAAVTALALAGVTPVRIESPVAAAESLPDATLTAVSTVATATAVPALATSTAVFAVILEAATSWKV